MTQWLLQSLPLPLILIDWSPLTADQHQQLLRAALTTGGRSVTLYEEIHPVKELGNRRVQQRFLGSLQALLPANVKPIIVADSGFRTPFFHEVESLGWHWLGRIRNRDFIAWANRPNDWLAAKSLYAKATRKPKCLGPLGAQPPARRRFGDFSSARQRPETPDCTASSKQSQCQSQACQTRKRALATGRITLAKSVFFGAGRGLLSKPHAN